jgi:hypothetical protein
LRYPDLFHDVSGSGGFNAWREDVELAHDFVKVFRVLFDDLHWFELFDARLFGDFVFAFIGIAFQVAYIGNIAHIAHFVSEKAQVAGDDIEGEECPHISEVHLIIDSGAAHIHADLSGVDAFEFFLFSREGVADVYRILIVACHNIEPRK